MCSGLQQTGDPIPRTLHHMETMAPPSEPDTTGPARRPLAVGATLCLLVVLMLGFALGSFWSGRHNTDTWHTGVAQTGIREISIEYDGWTYGANDSIPEWIDNQGTVHDSGWPDCLRGPGRHALVRFQAREVTVDANTWRPIIAIDCGG